MGERVGVAGGQRRRRAPRWRSWRLSGGGQRSRTRRSVQERDTQMYMQSPGRAFVVVEQGVAVVGQAREHGGLAGAADALPAGGEHLDPGARARASSTDTSGVTVTVVPVRASSTSNGRSCTAGAAAPAATNRSVRSACGGQAAQAASSGGQQRGRAAAVDLDVGAAVAEDAAQVGRSPSSSCGHDLHPVAVAGELVEEGHRAALAAAVEQLPVRAEQVGLVDHRQQRGDADAAGDEQVARRRHEREVVARAADPDEVARARADRGRRRSRRGRPARAARRCGR